MPSRLNKTNQVKNIIIIMIFLILSLVSIDLFFGKPFSNFFKTNRIFYNIDKFSIIRIKEISALKTSEPSYSEQFIAQKNNLWKNKKIKSINVRDISSFDEDKAKAMVNLGDFLELNVPPSLDAIKLLEDKEGLINSPIVNELKEIYAFAEDFVKRNYTYWGTVKIYLRHPKYVRYRYYKNGTVELSLFPVTISADKSKVFYIISIQSMNSKYRKDLLLARDTFTNAMTSFVFDLPVEPEYFLWDRFFLGSEGNIFDTSNGEEIVYLTAEDSRFLRFFKKENSEKAIITCLTDKFPVYYSFGHDNLYTKFISLSKNGDVKLIAKMKNPGELSFFTLSRFLKSMSSGISEALFEGLGWDEYGMFYFKFGNRYWKIVFK